jgi:predicted ATPase
MTAGRLALPATTLLERETELRAIDASLEAAKHGDGQLLVIEGEAGIGKSSLVERATVSAADSGFRVLSARCSELEREYPYGLVTGLFEPLLQDGSQSRSDPFRRSCGVGRPDPRSVTWRSR